MDKKKTFLKNTEFYLFFLLKSDQKTVFKKIYFKHFGLKKLQKKVKEIVDF